MATARVRMKHEIEGNRQKRAVQIAKLIDTRTMDIRRGTSYAQYESLHAMSFERGLIIGPIYTQLQSPLTVDR